ncbi:hypothetical protein C8Q80DRAFT_1219236 [Daedaleopsis nitida]|nr:hypothetical protein C8Q80DRAFT_1219236 [Daedaleopsis nitida]
MASVSATFRHALRRSLTSHATRPSPTLWHARALHSTPVVLKKKGKGSASEADDLFGESEADSEELFPSSSGDLFTDARPSKSSSSSVSASSTQPIPPHRPSVPLPRSVGSEPRFEEMIKVLHAYLVDKSTTTIPRSTMWLHIINVAASREHLERVAELFPKWRDVKRPFPPHTADHFAKRCERLRCPELALKIFSDHPKYGLDLTFDAARVVLHGLQASRPRLQSPPVTSDLLCTTMLLRALNKDGSEESLTVARTLVPALEKLLNKANPRTYSLQNKAQRPHGAKEKKWLAWTLNYLQSHIGEEWLKQWMEASGYAAFTAKGLAPP